MGIDRAVDDGMRDGGPDGDRPGRAALVGNDAARSVQGWSAGADVVVVGAELTVTMAESLAELSLQEPTCLVEGGAAGVLDLARAAWAHPDRPLVVVAAEVELELPALLDVLDRQGVATAALTVPAAAIDDGRSGAVLVRVGADGAALESVGTDAHVVTSPTHALAGIVRIDPEDREAAAAAWQRAGQRVEVADASDAFALAVLSLVRAGVRLRSIELGPFTWRAGAASSTGAPGSPWEQRLRGASRGGDGYLSTRVIRPVSRRVTRVGLGHGWPPNAVTAVSLGFGLAAAALITMDNRWAWVGAALLIQVALVVDCVDGEIARFTRRFNALGAWLDGIGDRVKEYAVFAAVALVATRHGAPGWLLAVAAMALVTLRHLEDYTYVDRSRPVLASRPDVIPLHQVRDNGLSGARTDLAPPRTPRAEAIYWAKKVIHFPIAERYLLISLTLLTFHPSVVLWVMIGASLVGVVWTQGGRTLKAIAGRDGLTDDLLPSSGRWSHLDHQMDLGPVARVVGRLGTMPAVVGLVAAGVLCVAALVGGLQQQILVVLVIAVPVVLIIGASCRPPVHDPLGWQLPAVLWLAEALVVWAAASCALPAGSRGSAYVWLVVVAYHRYDVMYRLRETGTGSAGWLALAGLGTDGRILLVLLVTTFAPGRLGLVLWAGAAVLGVLYVVESLAAWRTWSRARGATALPSAT